MSPEQIFSRRKQQQQQQQFKIVERLNVIALIRRVQPVNRYSCREISDEWRGVQEQKEKGLQVIQAKFIFVEHYLQLVLRFTFPRYWYCSTMITAPGGNLRRTTTGITHIYTFAIREYEPTRIGFNSSLYSITPTTKSS